MKKLLLITLIAMSSQFVIAEEGVFVHGFCVKKMAKMMGPADHNISLTTKNKRVIDALIEDTRHRKDLYGDTELAARAYYWGDHLTGVVVYDYANCVDEDGECAAYRTEYFYEILSIGNIYDEKKPMLKFTLLGTYFGDDQGPETHYICNNKVEKVEI